MSGSIRSTASSASWISTESSLSNMTNKYALDLFQDGYLFMNNNFYLDHCIQIQMPVLWLMTNN